MSESLIGSVEPTAAPSTVNRSHERTDGLTEMVVTEGGNLSGGNARDEQGNHCESCKCSPNLDRLLSRLDRSAGPGGCWIWTGYRNKAGYGLTHVPISGRRKTVIAHRAVYQLTTGVVLTPDVFLLHSCDNPPCCNPAHLREGDQVQNMADRKAHGAGYAMGLDNHRAVRHLTDEDIAEIRATYKWHTQGRGAPALGARFGVSRTVIEDIVNRRGRWAE